MNQENLETVAFYGAILLAKMFFVSILVSLTRLVTDTFANPEDSACSPRGRTSPPEQPDPNVERFRRLLNSDLEDILPFIMLSGLFLSTQPGQFGLLWACRVFAAARMVHTIAYLMQIGQPCRLIAYLTGMSVNLFMVWRIAVAFIY